MHIVIIDGNTLGPGLDLRGLEALGELTVYDATAPEQVSQRLADADAVIVNALYQRAHGHYVTETQVMYECGEEMKRFENVRYIAPDTAAMRFWLKNRRPDEWRDKRDVDTQGDNNIHITFGEGMEQYLV